MKGRICIYLLLHGLELPSLIFPPHFLSLNFFFFMWTILKVFIELDIVLHLSYVLAFWPWGMQDLSSPPGMKSTFPMLEGKVLTTGPQGKSPLTPFSFWFCISSWLLFIYLESTDHLHGKLNSGLIFKDHRIIEREVHGVVTLDSGQESKWYWSFLLSLVRRMVSIFRIGLR